MTYKFEIVDQAGRMWARTLTRLRAARIVRMLRESKGLVCKIEEINGGN